MIGGPIKKPARIGVDPQTALRRGITRDAAAEGIQEATRLHRDRYQEAEKIYLAEVCPQDMADVIIDNRDLASPRILRHRYP